MKNILVFIIILLSVRCLGDEMNIEINKKGTYFIDNSKIEFISKNNFRVVKFIETYIILEKIDGSGFYIYDSKNNKVHGVFALMESAYDAKIESDKIIIFTTGLKDSSYMYYFDFKLSLQKSKFNTSFLDTDWPPETYKKRQVISSLFKFIINGKKYNVSISDDIIDNELDLFLYLNNEKDAVISFDFN